MSRERGVAWTTVDRDAVRTGGTGPQCISGNNAVVARLKRLRGWLLRIVMKRSLSVAIGGLLAAPAIVVWGRDFAWESGVTDGLALLCFATGAALVWSGVSGRRADWIDDA